MQYWAKRGLRTVLVTGGMLMLGTGIAAADHNVDPDGAPSPLPGGIEAPDLDAAGDLMPASGLPAMPMLGVGQARSDVPQLPGLDLLGGLPFGSLQDTVTMPAVDDTQVIPAVPAAPEVGTLPSAPEVGSLPAAPEVGSLPAAPEVGSLPSAPSLPSLPADRDLPSAESGQVQGASGAAKAFQDNLQMPDSGSISGQLPLLGGLPTR